MNNNEDVVLTNASKITPPTALENCNVSENRKYCSKSDSKLGRGEIKHTVINETIVVPIRINEAAEERQRMGRYLAVGVTLVMLFIAFYHTFLKHTTVLAGLLAPAIIMLLYILWLLYFAKKRKAQVAAV